MPDLQIHVRTDADAGPLDQYNRSLGTLTGSARSLSSTFQGTTRAGMEFEHVMMGFERGGVGGAMQAVRGLRGLMHTLGPEFATVGAAVALPAMVIGVAIHEMNRRTAENRKEMEAIWEGARNRAEQYKEALKAIQEQASQMKESMVADFAEIDEKVEWGERMRKRSAKEDDATQTARRERAAAEFDVGREAALAGAKTPAEREAVAAEWEHKKVQQQLAQESTDLINQKLAAQNTLMSAGSEQKLARDKASGFRVLAAEAQSEATGAAEEATTVYKREGGTEFQRKLATQALEMRKKAELAAETAAEADKKAGDIIAHIQERVDEANTVLKTFADRVATIEAKQKAAALSEAAKGAEQAGRLRGASAEAEKQVGNLQQQVAAESEARFRRPGMSTAEDLSTADSLNSQLQQALHARDQTNASLADFFRHQADQERQTQREAKNLDDTLRGIR